MQHCMRTTNDVLDEKKGGEERGHSNTLSMKDLKIEVISDSSSFSLVDDVLVVVSCYLMQCNK